MWRLVEIFSNMLVYLAHLHIYSLKPKDLEPAHCHALCSSKRETGGLAMQSEGEIIPQIALAIRFLLLTRKELDATVCVWSIEYKASLSNPNMLGFCPFFLYRLFGTPCGFSKHPRLPGLRLASDAASWGTRARSTERWNIDTRPLGQHRFKLHPSARCQANAKARDEALVSTNSQQPALEKRNTRWNEAQNEASNGTNFKSVHTEEKQWSSALRLKCLFPLTLSSAVARHCHFPWLAHDRCLHYSWLCLGKSQAYGSKIFCSPMWQ